MALLSLIIAAQLNLFGPVARDWRYVSPCGTSREGYFVDHFERTAALPEKSANANAKNRYVSW